jgi:KEOPS complex subunit Pcc1
MMGFAEIELQTDRPDVLFRALAPELEDEINRSRVSIEAGQSVLRLRIEGPDLASLRAALNTWIRLLKIATEMMRI